MRMLGEIGDVLSCGAWCTPCALGPTCFGETVDIKTDDVYWCRGVVASRVA